MHHLNETAGALTLMGSGEMSPGMAETHRRIMRMIDGVVKPAFIDTPAGFELNVSNIREKALEYFKQNFDLDLAIVSFPDAAQATPLTMGPALHTLRSANYLFSGPGSPTYAVRNWRGTPVFETMAGKLAAGAQIVMASAATLALGRYTLPVYEIYKVGDAPRWVDGLDLLGRYGFDLAIVPHWNNNSGGYDTTHCFIGEARFDQLHKMLPAATTVLGIDEYTACTLMLHDGECHVSGAGTVTVMRNQDTRVFNSGETFSLGVLRAPNAATQNDYPSALTEATLQQFRQALRDHKPGSAVGYVHSLMELMRQEHEQAGDPKAQAHMQLMIREMLAALAIWLDEHQHADAPAGDDPLIERLMQAVIATRAGLRANKQYALADELRKRLSDADIELADTPAGTTWKRTQTTP